MKEKVGQLGVMKKMLQVHKYHQDKNFEGRSREIFDAYYKKYMKSLDSIEVITDTQLQIKGHDIHLHFTNGKTIVIDEKIRRKDYPDILIEYLSNKQTGRVGWIYETESDLFAYLFPTTGMYLLLAQKMKDWVKDEKSQFWELKDLPPAKNKRPDGREYESINKAVPVVLMNKMGFIFRKYPHLQL
jgi:hypothetical protein